jgi:hypothetical protein
VSHLTDVNPKNSQEFSQLLSDNDNSSVDSFDDNVPIMKNQQDAKGSI